MHGTFRFCHYTPVVRSPLQKMRSSPVNAQYIAASVLLFPIECNQWLRADPSHPFHGNWTTRMICVPVTSRMDLELYDFEHRQCHEYSLAKRHSFHLIGGSLLCVMCHESAKKKTDLSYEYGNFIEKSVEILLNWRTQSVVRACKNPCCRITQYTVL